MALQKIKETFDKLKSYKYEFDVKDYSGEYKCYFSVNGIKISSGIGKKKHAAKIDSAENGYKQLMIKDWDFAEKNGEKYPFFDYYGFLQEVVKKIEFICFTKVEKKEIKVDSGKYIQFQVEIGSLKAEGLNYNEQKAKHTCAFNMICLLRESEYAKYIEKTSLHEKFFSEKFSRKKIQSKTMETENINSIIQPLDSIYLEQKKQSNIPILLQPLNEKKVKIEADDYTQNKPYQDQQNDECYETAFNFLQCQNQFQIHQPYCKKIENKDYQTSEIQQLNVKEIVQNQQLPNLTRAQLEQILVSYPPTPTIQANSSITTLKNNSSPTDNKNHPQQKANFEITPHHSIQEASLPLNMNVLAKKLLLTNAEWYFFHLFLTKFYSLGHDYLTLGSYNKKSIRITKPELDIFVKNSDFDTLSNKIIRLFGSEFIIETQKQLMLINLKSQPILNRQLLDNIKIQYKINIFFEINDLMQQVQIKDNYQKKFDSLQQVPLLFSLAHQWKDDFAPSLPNIVLDYLIIQVTQELNYINSLYQALCQIIYLLKINVLEDIAKSKPLNPFLYEVPNEHIIKQIILIPDILSIQNIASQWNKCKAWEWVRKYIVA